MSFSDWLWLAAAPSLIGVSLLVGWFARRAVERRGRRLAGALGLVQAGGERQWEGLIGEVLVRLHLSQDGKLVSFSLFLPAWLQDNWPLVDGTDFPEPAHLPGTFATGDVHFDRRFRVRTHRHTTEERTGALLCPEVRRELLALLDVVGAVPGTRGIYLGPGGLTLHLASDGLEPGACVALLPRVVASSQRLIQLAR